MNRRTFIGGLFGSCVLGGCAGLFGRSRKLALNASTLRGYNLDLDAQVRAAIAGGFSGFEPWLKDVHAAKTAGKLRDIVARAKDGGLAFVNGIAFGRWVDPDPAVRKAGLEETKRDMDVLAEMDCPYVAASMFGMQKPGSPFLSVDVIAERFAAVCDLGDRTGVKPLLEYWGHSVNLNTPEGALHVLEKLGRPGTALLADVYHTYRGGGNFATFREFGDGRLPVLHVNDYPATPARERLVDADRVWPGDGIAPWTQIFAHLEAAGADPWLSIEVFNPAYWKTTPEQTARTGWERLSALVRSCNG